jgi:circadian clock protein KaiB
MSQKKTSQETCAEFEAALERSKTEPYVLRLYVSGVSPKSIRAITNVKKMCEEHLADRYELEVIDVYKRPTLAAGEQIVAVPTLIKKLPIPLQRLIGDMSNVTQVLLGIDLVPQKQADVHGKRRESTDSKTTH